MEIRPEIVSEAVYKTGAVSRVSRRSARRRLYQRLFHFLIAVIRLEPFLESPEGVSEVDLIPHTVLIVM